MSELKIDDTRWPVVHLALPAEFTADDLVRGVNRVMDMAKRQQPFAVVVDFSKGKTPSIADAKVIGAIIDQHRDLLRRTMRGNALVMSSAAMRTAINALILMVRPPYPTRVTATTAEGEAVCRAFLAEASTAATA